MTVVNVGLWLFNLLLCSYSYFNCHKNEVRLDASAFNINTETKTQETKRLVTIKRANVNNPESNVEKNHEHERGEEPRSPRDQGQSVRSFNNFTSVHFNNRAVYIMHDVSL